MFYSHVICLGTKIISWVFRIYPQFYSHVICLGTKIVSNAQIVGTTFYSHVICLGTKIVLMYYELILRFYSHVICLGTKISNLIFPTFVCHCPWVYYTIFHAFKKAISGFFSVLKIAKFNSTIHLYSGILFCTSGV